MRTVLALICSLSYAGCSLVGPSCLSRQQRGTGMSFEGEVPAGGVVSHVVRYETEGSQNDVHITWPGQGSTSGPRLTMYATKAACEGFVPPGGPADCAPLGGPSGISISGTGTDLIQTLLIVTNGRGNPDILGTPAQYKLWIVGDPTRRVGYSVNITWFYGPDC